MKPNFTQYQNGDLPTLPFYSSPIRAGFPSPADDFIDKHLDLNDHLIKHPSATFFFRAGTSSMEKAGIFLGDLLIVDRSLDPYDNAVIVAVLDGQFLIRYYRETKQGIVLTSAGNKEETQTVTEDRQFEVWGVVTSVVHRVQ